MKVVSDHAVLRFAERVVGLDEEMLRSHILAQLPRTRLINGKYPITYGAARHKAVVVDGVVVTVI
ncbi:MAG: hypothetical protein PW734_06855 [Verrucomicrobium sp.]|nr:hypothetical protein [Verrucomicrobium sp.]